MTSGISKNGINKGYFKKGQTPWNKGIKGLHHSPQTEFKKGQTAWNKGLKIPYKSRPKQTEKLLNLYRNGYINPNKGKTLSEETKQKQRLAAVKHRKLLGKPVAPNMGKNETRILDEKEKELGYKIIRQYQTCGYFLDGYIPKLNLAIEIDEKHHLRNKEKDKIREQNIIDKLNCKFLRIEDRY